MRSRAQVLYDGLCPLCIRSMHWLQHLDWLHRLEFVNARDLAHLPPHDPPLDPNQLLEQMHLLTPGNAKILRGFHAFRWIAWRLPLLLPLAPWLYLPGMARLGQSAYLWVARHRFQLVPCHGGLCAMPTNPAIARPSPMQSVPSQRTPP